MQRTQWSKTCGAGLHILMKSMWILKIIRPDSLGLATPRLGLATRATGPIIFFLFFTSVRTTLLLVARSVCFTQDFIIRGSIV